MMRLFRPVLATMFCLGSLSVTLAQTGTAAPAAPQSIVAVKRPAPSTKLTVTAESPELTRGLTENAMMLLNQANVQTLVGLDASTTTKYQQIMKDLGNGLNAKAEAGTITDADVQTATIAALKSASALLTDAQLTRTVGIALQVYGVEAFALPDFQEKLQLSSEQKSLIAGVVKKYADALDAYSDKVVKASIDHPGSDSDNAKVARNASDAGIIALRNLRPERVKLIKLNESLLKQVMEYLDQKQKQQYESMLGEKVTVVETYL